MLQTNGLKLTLLYERIFFCLSIFQEDKDWGFIAMVLDRLFLWMFTITTLVGSVVILITAPALYDDTTDMAIKYSLVAQQLYGIPDF